ncbi:S-layer homology domain-containing protein, partial [Patescibacteria group bacterium]|nr:S-layer homology domain-containing protein [Patescibacteria group bacterium]
GKISVPSTISMSNLPAPLPSNLDFENAIIISTNGEIFFDKDITITIPLTNVATTPPPKVYYYDTKNKEYILVGDGGTVSEDGKSISVQTNHLSTFVAVTEKAAAEEASVTMPFTDIEGHWALDYITNLWGMGVVQGRTGTTFVPDATLTRAEMVKIALLTFGHQVDSADTQTSFSDIPSTEWYAPYIAAAENAGIVGGYEDGTFRPDASVNRAEALKILLKASGIDMTSEASAPFMDVSTTAWYAQYVNFAYANGIVSGKTSTIFAPEDNVTRAEMAKMSVKTEEL